VYDMFPPPENKSGLGAATQVGLNVFMLPSSVAYDFIAFCYANYASGSIVDFTDRGSPFLFARSPAPIDVRKAAFAYDHMYGADRTQQTSSLDEAWTPDTVGVAVGCSVVVDKILLEAGIRLKHVEEGVPLAVYSTENKTRSVGTFSPLQHVSMRIVKRTDLERVIAITSRYPALHGRPVHVGDPDELGIRDLTSPLLGGGLIPTDDETCLFWGCGVTLRKALEQQEGLSWMANSEGSLVTSGRTIDIFYT